MEVLSPAVCSSSAPLTQVRALCLAPANRRNSSVAVGKPKLAPNPSCSAARRSATWSTPSTRTCPIDWSVEEGKRKNIKWIADLGSHCYGGPIIADGKVFVGTNNANPRDKKLVDQGPTRPSSWRSTKPTANFSGKSSTEFPDGESRNLPDYGLCSTPIVEGKRLYYVTPGCEVICADTAGKIKWTYDMTKELKVVPLPPRQLLAAHRRRSRHGRAPATAATRKANLPSPKAPSFVAINKKTGKLVWQSNLAGQQNHRGAMVQPDACHRQWQTAGDFRRRRLCHL